jgi:hypothetical protein
VPRRPRQLDPSNPVHVFAARLREFYLAAGKPTQKDLARQIHSSRPSLSAFLNARRFPTWNDAEAFVRVCRGTEEDVQQLRELWAKVRKALEDQPGLLSEPTTVQPAAGAVGEIPGVVAGSAASLEALTRPVPGLPSDEEPKQETVTLTWFEDNEEFYSTTAEHVVLARRRILLTYIRQFPPPHYTSHAAASYFQTVLDWAREPGARSVRRIINISNAEMREWAVRHLAETREIRNYEARALNLGLQADLVNMALIDDATTCLLFSGTAFQEVSGLKFDSPRILSHYRGHFEQLWATCVPLDTFLGKPR